MTHWHWIYSRLAFAPATGWTQGWSPWQTVSADNWIKQVVTVVITTSYSSIQHSQLRPEDSLPHQCESLSGSREKKLWTKNTYHLHVHASVLLTPLVTEAFILIGTYKSPQAFEFLLLIASKLPPVSLFILGPLCSFWRAVCVCAYLQLILLAIFLSCSHSSLRFPLPLSNIQSNLQSWFFFKKG